jgi:Fe-S cluster biogenesis protein NfuA
MKMGIERILRERWPELGEVVDIGGGEEEELAPKELTIQTAHDALETIMPAIAGLGGSVRIVEAVAAESKIVLEYTGPEKIKFGIELALKDSPLIDTVEFV